MSCYKTERVAGMFTRTFVPVNSAMFTTAIVGVTIFSLLFFIGAILLSIFMPPGAPEGTGAALTLFAVIAILLAVGAPLFRAYSYYRFEKKLAP